MRSSARKQTRNAAVKSRVQTMQAKYATALTAGKKDESAASMRAAVSALDKAVKAGVIKKSTANRKKSRLALRLNKAK
ncbi:MAG: Ribosomal protein [Verrucomicrobiota bacterium]